MSRNASKVDWSRLWLLAGALAGPALALESDRQQPMQINAERFESGMQANTTVLTGNVKITQGSLIVNAARADVTQDKGEVTRALLTGRPATLRQAMDGGGDLNASAGSIDYKLGEESVELTGDVILERPQGTLRSQRVVYSIKTGRLAAGEGVGGGVQLVIPPKTPKAADPAATPQG